MSGQILTEALELDSGADHMYVDPVIVDAPGRDRVVNSATYQQQTRGSGRGIDASASSLGRYRLRLVALQTRLRRLARNRPRASVDVVGSEPLLLDELRSSGDDSE